jgi:hypothetical protein
VTERRGSKVQAVDILCNLLFQHVGQRLFQMLFFFRAYLQAL